METIIKQRHLETQEIPQADVRIGYKIQVPYGYATVTRTERMDSGRIKFWVQDSKDGEIGVLLPGSVVRIALPPYLWV